MLAQEAGAECMDRSHERRRELRPYGFEARDLLRIGPGEKRLRHLGGDAPLQFARGLLGVGEGNDLLDRGIAFEDETEIPFDKDAGLPRAGVGGHGQMPPGSCGEFLVGRKHVRWSSRRPGEEQKSGRSPLLMNTVLHADPRY